MKKTFRYLLAMVAIVAIAACEEESLPEPPAKDDSEQTETPDTPENPGEDEPEEEEPSPTMEKTFSFVSENEDDVLPSDIIVYDNLGGSNDFTLGEDEKYSGIVSTGSESWVAACPAESIVSKSENSIRFRIPASQQLAASTDNCDKSALIAVAQAGENGLAFRNAFSKVKVTITEDQAYDRIFIVGYNDELIAGEFDVTIAESPAMSIVDETGAKVVSLSPAEGQEAFGAGDYYIILPPTAFTKGYKVILGRKEDALVCPVAVVAESFTTERNTVKDIVLNTPQTWGHGIFDQIDLNTWRLAAKDATAPAYILNHIAVGSWNEAPVTGQSIYGLNHRLYDIFMESNESVSFINTVNYPAEIHDLVFGSKDGTTYDGKSYIRYTNNTTKTGFHYIGLFGDFKGKALNNIKTYIPVTQTEQAFSGPIRISGLCAIIRPGADNSTTVTKCYNYGDITCNAAVASGNEDGVGGLCGFVDNGTINFATCENHGDITYSAKTTTHQLCIGGILTRNSGSTTKITFSSVNNYGDITLTATEQGKNIYMGGIAGRIDKAPAMSQCNNYGNLTCSAKKLNTVVASGVTSVNSVFGGIAGYIHNGTTFTECTNKGKISIDGSETAAVSGVTNFICVGGIIGQMYTVTLEKCKNLTDASDRTRGEISIKFTQQNRVGGIAGSMSNGYNCKANYCKNEGYVHLEQGILNSTWQGVAGILGFADGSGKKIELNHCENSGNVSNEAYTSSITAAGGFVGRGATWKIILNGKNTGNITATNKNSGSGSAYAGGIFGITETADNGFSVENSVNYGEITANRADISSSNGNVYCGGIGGRNGATSGSTITGVKIISCENYGNIVSRSRPGSILGCQSGPVTNCKVGGSYNGTPYCTEENKGTTATNSHVSFGLYKQGDITGCIYAFPPATN